MHTQLLHIVVDVLFLVAAAEGLMIGYGLWANAQSR